MYIINKKKKYYLKNILIIKKFLITIYVYVIKELLFCKLIDKNEKGSSVKRLEFH